MRTTLLTLVCGGLALSGAPAAAQQAPPKPGPEHKMLQRFEGDWDATVAMAGAESKATAKYKMGLGGFWLSQDFKGEFGGQKFHGKGTTGYDPLRKKYVSTWTDSMSPTLIVMEGKFDKDGKTYTETGEGPGMDGKLTKLKSVLRFKDKDTLLFTMYTVQNGEEQEMMKITYRRKK